MWGQCHGQNVLTPVKTNFTNVDDVFACFSCPPCSYRPIISGLINFAWINKDLIVYLTWSAEGCSSSPSVSTCIESKFDDPVWSESCNYYESLLRWSAGNRRPQASCGGKKYLCPQSYSENEIRVFQVNATWWPLEGNTNKVTWTVFKTPFIDTIVHYSVIELKNHSYQIYHAFIKYLYTDRVELNSSALVGQCKGLVTTVLSVN